MAWAKIVSAWRASWLMTVPFPCGSLPSNAESGRKRAQPFFGKSAEGVGVSAGMELAKEPGPGISPMALRRGAGDAEHLGGLFQAAPREETELDDLGLLRVQGLQFFQGFIEGQEIH